MPSNKLSVRVATALRPPVCRSLDPDMMWFLYLAQLQVIWTDQLATPPLTFLNQVVTLERIAPGSSVYAFYNFAAGPGEIVAAELSLQFTPTYNLLAITGNDEGGASHSADVLFEPSQPMPFNQTVELFSPDYPEPGSVIAHIAPTRNK